MAAQGSPRRTAALSVGAEVRLAWRWVWLSRLVVWAAGLGALALFGESSRAPGFDPTGVTEPFGAAGDTLVAPAARWDSYWFLTIAEQGYDESARAAFFPLYPLLTKALGVVLLSPLVAGIALSTACFVGALLVLHRLTELELGAEAARWTIVALALSPMSFFLSAVYSEALFLLVSVGAVYAVRQGHWAWAGVLGALGAATRSAGVVLVVALALLAWAQRARVRDAAWIGLAPLGLLAFLGGLELGGLDGLAPFDVQEVWFREWAGPYLGIWDGVVAAWDGARQLLSGSRTPVYYEQAGGDPFSVARMNLVLFAWIPLAAVALVGAARRLPPAYAAYALAALTLPLSYPVGPQPLMSLPRFLLVLFPLWMWLGAWLAGHPRARVPFLAVSVAGLAISSALFTTWRFVA